MPSEEVEELLEAQPENRDMLVVVQDRVTERLNADATASGQPMQAIDPTVWLNVFQTVITLIQQCRAAQAGTPSAPPASNTVATARVANTLASPTLMQRIKLRRGIISKVGRGEFKATAEKMVQHLVEVGSSATSSERQAFVHQIAVG